MTRLGDWCEHCGHVVDRDFRPGSNYCSQACTVAAWRRRSGEDDASVPALVASVKDYQAWARDAAAGVTLSPDAVARYLRKGEAWRLIGEPTMRAYLQPKEEMPRDTCRWYVARSFATGLGQRTPTPTNALQELLGRPCTRCTRIYADMARRQRTADREARTARAAALAASIQAGEDADAAAAGRTARLAVDRHRRISARAEARRDPTGPSAETRMLVEEWRALPGNAGRNPAASASFADFRARRRRESR